MHLTSTTPALLLACPAYRGRTVFLEPDRPASRTSEQCSRQSPADWQGGNRTAQYRQRLEYSSTNLRLSAQVPETLSKVPREFRRIAEPRTYARSALRPNSCRFCLVS